MNASSKPKAPLTIRRWILAATEELRAVNIPTPYLDSELILAYCLGQNRTWIHAHSDDEIPATIAEHASRLLKHRAQRIPLAYLTGTKEFYGRSFIVTSDVLIPRPESEALIDLAKQHHISGRVLDVGCGSGALGLTLALELSARVTLSDISHKALDVARKNARALGVEQVRFVHSDLLAHWTSHQRPTRFDAIVANLPYVDEAWERSPETHHEPALALIADDHGLKLIYDLLGQIPRLLAPAGYALLEADPVQHADIIACGQQNGLRVEAVRDYIVVFQRS